MANTIGTINYEAFGKDLLNKIMDMGLGTFSKTDIYDYILYIANKNSSDKFLYNRSNHDNAIDFKVTETKIKNSKMNISLKFKTAEEKECDLNDFLFKLSNKQIKILDTDEKIFVFYIDDYFVRMELENQLKKYIGITLDYKLNNEYATIERADFITFLAVYSNQKEDYIIGKFEEELKTDELKGRINKGAATFRDKILGVAGAVTAEILAGFIASILFPPAIVPGQ